jgi:hypothetical protein
MKRNNDSQKLTITEAETNQLNIIYQVLPGNPSQE